MERDRSPSRLPPRVLQGGGQGWILVCCWRSISGLTVHATLEPASFPFKLALSHPPRPSSPHLIRSLKGFLLKPQVSPLPPRDLPHGAPRSPLASSPLSFFNWAALMKALGSIASFLAFQPGLACHQDRAAIATRGFPWRLQSLLVGTRWELELKAAARGYWRGGWVQSQSKPRKASTLRGLFLSLGLRRPASSSPCSGRRVSRLLLGARGFHAHGKTPHQKAFAFCSTCNIHVLFRGSPQCSAWQLQPDQSLTPDRGGERCS